MYVWFRCCRLERLNPNAFLAFAWIGIVVVAQASAAERTATARPATVADATRVLDLTTFPAMKGAKEPLSRSVSRLSYNVPGDCQTAFDFHRKTLTSMKWSEVSGSSVTKDYGSGMFTCDGFLASVSVAPLGDPSQPGTVNVSLTLHGNVDLAKLPIPADLKATYVGPQIAMYTAGGSVTETAEACRKLLLAQGWQPYGKAGDSLFFKQNALRLTVTSTAAPALGGKTSVSYSAEQLSADLPAPSDTVQLQYADSTKQVLFDTKDSAEAIVAFYRKTLGGSGWRATTDNTLKIGWKSVLIFRNTANDMLTLEMYPVEDENVLRVTLKHQSAAEVAAIQKQLDEEAAAAKKKKEMPLSRLAIPLPAQAKITEQAESRLEFTVGPGKGKAVSEWLRKWLRNDGWKEEVITVDAMVGEIGYTKDEQELSLSYVDTGFTPAEVTLTATGVRLQVADRKE
jgi:hypothetical protein